MMKHSSTTLILTNVICLPKVQKLFHNLFFSVGQAEKMELDKCNFVPHFECLMHQGHTCLALEMSNMNPFDIMMEEDFVGL